MAVDYSVFDGFCKVATWDTNHELDRRRFVEALDSVVRDPTFSAQRMGLHIDQNAIPPVWGISAEKKAAKIAELVEQADRLFRIHHGED